MTKPVVTSHTDIIGLTGARSDVQSVSRRTKSGAKSATWSHPRADDP
jgi:hypothetical protein